MPEKNKKEFVILVNTLDRKIGIAEKMEAHAKGLLHRAFSIFVFNSEGKMLLQKRAAGKYHFAGLWSNACCSHPNPGESMLHATSRRLNEELGILAKLKPAGHILYKCNDDQSRLTEYEYDHIFTAIYDGYVKFNPAEVAEIRWVTKKQLSTELRSYPQIFTPWLKLILKKIKL